MPSLPAPIATAVRSIGRAGPLLPASMLNFVAGLLAGAGINLLTAVEMGPTRTPTRDVVLDSVAWIGAAVFAAWAAHVAEGATRNADLATDKDSDAKMRRAIQRDEALKAAPRFWPVAVAALACIGFAVSQIPLAGQQSA